MLWEERTSATKSPLSDLAAIDRLLIEGVKVGTASKRRAINKVLREFPEFTRGDCWQRIRHLRKTPELACLAERQRRNCGSRSSKADRHPPCPWTPADDDKFLNWAGYEPVDKIAQRLSRSVRAVRFRLCALGMSAKVTDGWSLRALRKLLRVSPARLRQFIGSSMLRVRDARVTDRAAGVRQNYSSSILQPQLTTMVVPKKICAGKHRESRTLG